jgi:hypothetical protein
MSAIVSRKKYIFENIWTISTKSPIASFGKDFTKDLATTFSCELMYVFDRNFSTEIK